MSAVPNVFGSERLRQGARELYDDTVHRIGERKWARMTQHARWAELCVEFCDMICEHPPETANGSYLRNLSAVLRRLFELRDCPQLERPDDAGEMSGPTLRDPAGLAASGN